VKVTADSNTVLIYCSNVFELNICELEVFLHCFLRPKKTSYILRSSLQCSSISFKVYR
jgi:hypothetical protein